MVCTSAIWTNLCGGSKTHLGKCMMLSITFLRTLVDCFNTFNASYFCRLLKYFFCYEKRGLILCASANKMISMKSQPLPYTPFSLSVVSCTVNCSTSFFVQKLNLLNKLSPSTFSEKYDF